MQSGKLVECSLPFLCIATLQCEWVEKNGIHPDNVAINHYMGGKISGRKYLEQNSHIPSSFLVSTKPGWLIN